MRRLRVAQDLMSFMRTFAAMDSYNNLEVLVWYYFDGNMEIDMDVRTNALLPPLHIVSVRDIDNTPCYVASLVGDTSGGEIEIVYVKDGVYSHVLLWQYKRHVDRYGHAILRSI